MTDWEQIQTKPRVGDIVYLSKNGLHGWEVVQSNASNNTLYLRSLVGCRSVPVSSGQVVSIWRKSDSTIVDHRALYQVDGPWDNDDAEDEAA